MEHLSTSDRKIMIIALLHLLNLKRIVKTTMSFHLDNLLKMPLEEFDREQRELWYKLTYSIAYKNEGWCSEDLRELDNLANYS